MANSPLGTKDRPYRATLSGINGESSSDITAGDAVCYNADGTRFVLPSSLAAATAPGLFAGIATHTAKIGQPLDVVCGGFTKAKLIVNTRAASTDSWASVASVAAGAYLTVNTALNGVATSGAGAALASPYLMILPASRASSASSASATSDTRTLITASASILVRNLF